MNVVFDFGGGFRTNRFGLGVAFSASRKAWVGLPRKTVRDSGQW